MKSSEYKKILNKYGGSLVEIVTVPNITTKQIVYVQSFKDILNIKDKSNKPIYYLVGEQTVDFVYIDKNAYIYTIKDNNKVQSVLEDYNSVKNDYEIIKRVEQDTVIECGDGTEFLVSRIDNK